LEQLSRPHDPLGHGLGQRGASAFPSSTVEEAMNLAAVAAVLGGEVVGRQVLAPGPGHSPRDRSLSVRFTSGDEFVVHSFAGDDPIACKDYVRSKLGLPQWEPGDGRDRTVRPQKVAAWDRAAAERDTEKRSMTEDEIRNREFAVKIWNAGQDPRGTLAEKYLRQTRKLDLPDDLAGTVLRFHPRCPWRNENTGHTERVPALIAAFRSIEDDSITGIHRIALNPDGSKRGRMMLGPVRRAAVKLDQTVGDELVIGEGIETCMAARQLGLSGSVWALGSVGAITFFPVLQGIPRLTLLAETGEASEKAIRVCRLRWSRAGRRTRTARSTVGSDFNDALMAGTQ
jgi:Toprim domain